VSFEHPCMHGFEKAELGVPDCTLPAPSEGMGSGLTRVREYGTSGWYGTGRSTIVARAGFALEFGTGFVLEIGSQLRRCQGDKPPFSRLGRACGGI